MPVTGVGVDGRDDPVLGHPPSDPTPSRLVQILAGDGRQQLGRVTDRGLKLAAVERHEQRAGVLGQRVDQRLARLGPRSHTPACPRRGIIIAPQLPAQLALQLRVATEAPPDRRAPNVTVSIVATAS